MKLKNLLHTGTVLAFASFLLTITKTQAVLISGTSVNGDDDSHTIGDQTIANSIIHRFSAIGFTLPWQSYTLTDVLLRLNDYDGPSEAKVGIYLDSGSGSPGALHALLTDPAGGGLGSYTFLPAGTVNLAANTAYWLVVGYEPLTDEGYSWLSAQDATSGVAAFNGLFMSIDGGTSFSASGSAFSSLRYEINGTLVTSSAVPDTGCTLPLLGAALAGLAWFNRRQKH